MKRSRSRSGQVTKGHLLHEVGATRFMGHFTHRIKWWYSFSDLGHLYLLGRGQVSQFKSGLILKLVVWNKIGVCSIQLSSASSTIPFWIFIFVSCLELWKSLIENLGMLSFWRFLDDWGTKYRRISLKIGMDIEEMRFYYIYSGFFNF